MKKGWKLLGAFAVLSVAVVLLAGLFLWQSYQYDIRTTGQRSQVLAQLLHDHLKQTLDRVAMVLNVQASDFAPALLQPAAVPRNREQVAARMRRLIENLDIISGTYFFDAHGDLLYTSDPTAKAANIADRPFFRLLRDHPELGMVYSDALVARTTGRWSIVVARAVTDEQGRFAGVTTALLDLASKSSALQKLDMPAGSTLLIRRSDTNQLVFRDPFVAELMNQPLPYDNPIRRAVDSGQRQATLDYTASTDNIRRLSTFLVLQSYPFYVQAGFAVDEQLTQWRKEATWALAIAAVLLVLMGLGFWRMWRNALQEERLAGEVRRANQRYVHLFENSPDAYLIMDIHDGRILDCNAAALKMLHGDRSSIIGKIPADFSPPQQPDGTSSASGVQVRIDECLRSGGHRFEWVHRRCDGEDFWVEVTVSTMITEVPPVLFVAWREVSDRKRSEDELVVAKNAAEAANVAKSTFLANMSHEIRTPLNGILGMAYLISRDGLTPSQAARMAILQESSRHLLGILNGVLDLAKIEAGKCVIEQSPFNAEILVGNVTTMVSHTLQEKHLILRSDIGPLPGSLLGDMTRLEQALLNYVGNAVKFSERGEISLRVEKLVEDASSVLVRFEVSDTGIGIAPEVLPRLFDVFEQADNSSTRQYGGTGLGLALVRRLAALMGGEVGARSTPGTGSTFWFTARLTKAAPQDAGEATPAAPLDSLQMLREQPAGRRVLLVEDEPVNRMIAELLLTDAGLVVDLAEDGERAVCLAGEHDYDLILMDVQMPRMNGLDATRTIRNRLASSVPILAVTGNAFEQDRQQCLAAGMNDFIAKPYITEDFYATLLRWLSH